MVVMIASILLSIAAANYQTRINKARLVESVDEMMSIAQASRDFYNDRFSQGAWPSNTGDLYPKYMYTSIISSPFGNYYQIDGHNNAVTVATLAPAGLAQHYYQGMLLQIIPGLAGDIISITQELTHEMNGRLAYDKKYLYKQ